MTARRVALALVAAAAALVAVGVTVGSTGAEFGALAAIAAAWLVHDFARSAQAAELDAVEVTSCESGCASVLPARRRRVA